jgi:hypothetical protein
MVLTKAGKQEFGGWGQVFGKRRKLGGEMFKGIFYREFYFGFNSYCIQKQPFCEYLPIDMRSSGIIQPFLLLIVIYFFNWS